MSGELMLYIVVCPAHAGVEGFAVVVFAWDAAFAPRTRG